MLTLSEELYLALHYSEKEVAVVPLADSTAHLVTAGGLIAELLLAGRLRLDDTSLTVVDTSSTEDELLNEALYRLQPTTTFAADNAEWFDAIAQQLPLGGLMFARLEEKGVIRPLQKRKMFGLSSSTIYPLQDPSVLPRWQSLQMDVLVNGRTPTVPEAVLLFMCQVWGFPLPAELSRKDRKTAENRWERLFGDYWGIYPNNPTDPIPNLDSVTRTALGNMTVSWATTQAIFVAEDVRQHLVYLHRMTS
ncbi:MAG: GPP34 family phosphoprotein [Anaerolineales bacterium]|nr:GPP34 family phosphoprotein [Anaerolineales bacterium]